MDVRKLAQHRPLVSKIALGGVAMSDLYGHARNDKESLATPHAAIDAGVTLLDTGDFYGSGHNALLIGATHLPYSGNYSAIAHASCRSA